MPDFVEQQHDFSLVLGGPIFQLFRRAHLEGDHLELLRRRVTIITLLGWLPLLLLSVFTSPNGGARLSFLHDIEVHARFLVVLPILIGGELLVHLRIRPVVREMRPVPFGLGRGICDNPAGDTGEVYKASDTNLDRAVGVTFSSEEFSGRSEREAHAVGPTSESVREHQIWAF